MTSPEPDDLEQLNLKGSGNEYRAIADNNLISPVSADSPSIELSVCSISSRQDSSKVSSLPSDDCEATVNPFQLRTKKSIRIRSEQLIESLDFNAAELAVECTGFGRFELFSNPRLLVALFTQGITPGEWELVGKSEDVPCSANMGFLKKFRVRAGTTLDREERMLLAVFDQTAEKVGLTPTRALGQAQFTIADILESKQMMMQKELQMRRKRANVKPSILLALEMVYHVDHDQQITFEVGFLEDAPLRNRMFVVISRALRRGKWSPVYRSEVRVRQDVEKFDPITLGIQEFNGGDPSKLFRIEVHRAYKNGQSKLLGFVQTSYEKLSSMETNNQLYWWPAREGITSARVIIQSAESRGDDDWYSLRVAGHP